MGLVGESGCGKSTTGKAIIKLNDITDGEILYEGQDIQKIAKRKDLLKFNKKIQMIFQDVCFFKSTSKSHGYCSRRY